MTSLLRICPGLQVKATAITVATIIGFAGFVPGLWAQAAKAPVLPIPDADAKSAAEMKGYTELVEHTDATIAMVPIPGGEFLMGSPDSEEGRNANEGPQHKVKIEPFWMSKCEITWDAFEVWMFDLDIQRRELNKTAANERDKAAEEYQISQPTEPYTDMTFGMGKRGFPAICMTQDGASVFCKWLSTKTGRYYRLPTEAEWEYACRAGTTTAYSFGDDAADLDDYAWYFDNSDEKYHKVGEKKPNPWGLHDMHGNVSEWVLDQLTTDFYGKSAGQVADNPLCLATKFHPRTVRGGSWDDDPEMLRSATRQGSSDAWSQQDPQIPKSMWYHTDALQVGFRIIRPLTEPSDADKAAKWEFTLQKLDRKRGR
jgi:formylglycine-generating enzyme required for sulfatase activity